MTLTAHVPAPTRANAFELVSINPFADLGERLVQFGLALQNTDSKAGDLNQLAKACGLDLRIKLVEVDHAS